MKKKNVKKLILFALLVFTFATYFSVKASGEDKTSYTKVIVYPGDTLWQIASKYKHSDDVRKVIYNIREKNNLKSANIYPGQELMVPLY